MKFESGLAKRVAAKKNWKRNWLTYAGLVGAVFIVLNLNAIALAQPQAVIHLGTKGSVAKYLGQFDGRQNVVMLGTSTLPDWVCIKIPFKGRLGNLESISFEEFVAQSGGLDSLEPNVVIKLSNGVFLVCCPSDSYESGAWNLPLSEWQLRDTVSKGKWSCAGEDAKTQLVALQDWVSLLGNKQVTGISLLIGHWDTETPFQCYVGGLTINGKSIDLANAGKITGSKVELPPGF